MFHSDLINGIAAGMALLLSVIAAWTMHRRLRTRSSAGFAWSTTAMCLWPFLSSPAMALVIYYSGNPLPEPWANALGVAIDSLIPMLLTLASAVLFLLAVRGIERHKSPSV